MIKTIITENQFNEELKILRAFNTNFLPSNPMKSIIKQGGQCCYIEFESLSEKIEFCEGLGISPECKDILKVKINKLPSFNSAKKLIKNIPDSLNDLDLVKVYGKLKSIFNANAQQKLSNDYYAFLVSDSATGYVPKDLSLLTNIYNSIEEYEKEINIRNLNDKFAIIFSI